MNVDRFCCISPKEARELHDRIEFRPEEFYEAINRLLVEKYDEEEIKILQPELINLTLELSRRNARHVSYADVFEKGWLCSVEDIGKVSGWIVEYYKPERGVPYWIFKESKAK